MILTLNEIVDLFAEFSTKHKQLNDFGWGMTYDIGTTYQMKMPYLWLTHRGANRIIVTGKQQTKLFNFTVILADKINQSKNLSGLNGFKSDNTGDIINRMDLIVHDLISFLNEKLTKAYIDGDVSVELAYDQTDDKVAGWVLDLTIKAVYKNCINPIND